ncbi:MAG: ribonuclease P protein component [Alphaproteobacteria bacterium]|nr:ribonuclease P protein component [Alphaproteobacteria bacterium]
MSEIRPVRMKKHKMFVNVNQNGIKVVAGGMVVQACPNNSDTIRIGFTVTKKIGCAVVRNRTRRRLKELVRTEPKIGNMAGFDLVFIGRLSTRERPYPKLRADLIYALNEIQRQFTSDISHE